VLRLTKAQLDGSCSDPRYEEDFFIDLIFAPVTVSPSDADGTGAATDSGIIIESVSTDKYEASLHKDVRFWESIAARKTKNKKRRSRKFISSQQEQFSISDDSERKRLSSSSEDGLSEEVSFLTSKNNKSKAKDDADMEKLILQLAQAEEGNDTDSPLPNASAPVSVDNVANMELQALEDLEKELGLGDLNLFGNNNGNSNNNNTTNSENISISSASASASVVNEGTVVVGNESNSAGLDDDDNLDELEKYLQSLSSS
jgi:hypothetical protein